MSLSIICCLNRDRVTSVKAVYLAFSFAAECFVCNSKAYLTASTEGLLVKGSPNFSIDSFINGYNVVPYALLHSGLPSKVGSFNNTFLANSFGLRTEANLCFSKVGGSLNFFQSVDILSVTSFSISPILCIGDPALGGSKVIASGPYIPLDASVCIFKSTLPLSTIFCFSASTLDLK